MNGNLLRLEAELEKIGLMEVTSGITKQQDYINSIFALALLAIVKQIQVR